MKKIIIPLVILAILVWYFRDYLTPATVYWTPGNRADMGFCDFPGIYEVFVTTGQCDNIEVFDHQCVCRGGTDFECTYYWPASQVKQAIINGNVILVSGSRPGIYQCLGTDIWYTYLEPTTTTTTPVPTTTTPGVTTIPQPEPPQPPKRLWDILLETILGWLRSIFKFFTGTIVAQQSYEPGATAVFTITLSSPIDTNCNDGFCQVQYGSYAVVDKAGAIVVESDWVEKSGTWTESISVVLPTDTGSYAFVAILYNYDLRYNGQWVIEKEYIAVKEAVEFTIGIPPPVKPTPPTGLLTQIINSILDFLRNLFSWFT